MQNNFEDRLIKCKLKIHISCLDYKIFGIHNEMQKRKYDIDDKFVFRKF